MKHFIVGLAVVLSAFAFGETFVDVSGVGTRKFSVKIDVRNQAFAKCLAKNLELSGIFRVGNDGTIKVSDATGRIVAEGSGKTISSNEPFADEKGARMAARKLSNAMCEAFGNQKGFALDRVLFLKRGKLNRIGGTLPGEICLAYPDGYDIRQLTSDAQASVFPRWNGEDSIYYIGYLNQAPQVWELNVASCKRTMKWSFKGSPTGIAVSPDGAKVAAVLSFQGNPELYVIDVATGRWTRLTTTPGASEGQPTWSPDGKKIAYVSNETRRPQIYVIDVATRAKRRLTSKGRENVDPDWGRDGRIAYITKRGGAQIAVMNPAEGDETAELVTEEANWEHPSWSRDMRHLVANRDRAIFVIDTLKDGDAPRQMFFADGNWISPSWSKR